MCYRYTYSCRLTKNRYQKWLEALGINSDVYKLSNLNRICSVHFDKSDLTITPRGTTTLKHGAVPKYNLGPNVEQRKLSLSKGISQTKT